MSRAFASVLIATLVVGASSAVAKETRSKVSGVVNLNTATAAQLDLLPSVGEKAAKQIIAFRTATPFKRIEDLVKVKGFGKKRFEKMRPHLAVSGETTIKSEKAAQARTGPPRR